MLLSKNRVIAETLALAVLGLAFTRLESQQAGVTQPSPNPPGHTIVFMTDFGLLDDSVAICKAVMLGLDPTLRIMDITHQVTPYSIPEGARFLAGTTAYYGPGTVFVAVIDPGVGSARKAIVAKSRRGQYFVAPDNGLLTMVQDQDGILEVREMTNPDWMTGGKLSSTFHGRDIFSPVGARIARGDEWTEVGPVVPKLVRLTLTPPKMEATGLSGEVIATDGPYGNLITNIGAAQFALLGYGFGDRVRFTIAGKMHTRRLGRPSSAAAGGEPLLYIDSRGRLAIAVNQGTAKARLHTTPPTRVLFEKRNGPVSRR